jgi:hypothetical protein
VSGWLLSSAAFVALYGTHAVACAVLADPAHARLAVLSVWAAFLLGHAGHLLWVRRLIAASVSEQRPVPLVQVTIILTVTATVATGWCGTPVLLGAACH